MLKDFLSHIFNKYTLLLYSLGLFISFYGLFFSKTEGILGGFAKLWEPLGFSIVAGTMVAAVLNFSFHKAIHEAFSIVKGAEGSQLKRIYVNRKKALSRIIEAVSKAHKSIDIITVSGTSVLHPEGQMLNEIERRSKGTKGIEGRILLLDPRSRFAVERSLREEGEHFPPLERTNFDYHDRKLCQDSMLSLLQVEKLISKEEKCRVEARLYNVAPMFFYVRVDDTVFVEQYHYGVPKEQVQSPFTRCLGKAVPVLESKAASDLGQVMHSHFEYVWERSKNRIITESTRAVIREALESNNWVEYYSSSSDDEDTLLDLPE